MRINRNKRMISRYLAYDIYYVGGRDVTEAPLIISNNCLDKNNETHSRLNILHRFVGQITENRSRPALIKPNIFFRINVKDFYPFL